MNAKSDAVSQQTQKTVSKKRAKYILLILAGIAAAVTAFLLLRSCGSGAAAAGNTLGGTSADWSGWMDVLPANVTASNYDIEVKTLYSSRTMETTSSTKSSTMSGWELYDTVAAGSGFGPWGDWSMSAVTATSSRQVETQTRYRYGDKETTTSTKSSLSGWELYDTTYSWGDYGAWSDWSTSAISDSDSRQVQTKTQYRYRDVTYTQEYSAWSDWSAWSFDRQSTSDLKKEETRTVWGYYYFKCPSCGAHMHGWGFTCPKWAGGCGKATILESSWHAIWSGVSWDNAGLKDWHGTGKYYTYLNGELVFKWSDNGQPRSQYRYATRSIVDVVHYGNWSNWSDTAYSGSSTREVETRTVYRYRDRSQIPTYHFFRWGSWSGWSPNKVSSTNNRRVETATFYRYRDEVNTTTYYFRRWSDWSAYSESTVTPSDTVQVQTRKQYRYRPKAS